MQFLLLLILLSDIKYEDPEVYQRFGQNQTVMDEQGYLYITTLTLGHVIRYDPQGRIVGKIGRKGPGPGEFEMIARLDYHETSGKLYVWDLRKNFISVFHKNGELQQSIRKPGQRLSIPFKTYQGWLTSEDKRDGLMILATWDHAFNNRKTFFEWERDLPNNPKKISFAKSPFKVTLNGKFAFLHQANTKSLNFIIFNLQTGQRTTYHKKVAPIHLDAAMKKQLYKPLRGETSWLEEEIAPFVKSVRPWRQDQMLVYYNIHYFNDRVPPLVITAQGEERKEALTPEQFTETLLMHDQWRITALDTDEGLVLRKVMN